MGQAMDTGLQSFRENGQPFQGVRGITHALVNASTSTQLALRTLWPRSCCAPVLGRHAAIRSCPGVPCGSVWRLIEWKRLIISASVLGPYNVGEYIMQGTALQACSTCRAMEHAPGRSVIESSTLNVEYRAFPQNEIVSRLSQQGHE